MLMLGFGKSGRKSKTYLFSGNKKIGSAKHLFGDGILKRVKLNNELQ
jgi:hypothetical protein